MLLARVLTSLLLALAARIVISGLDPAAGLAAVVVGGLLIVALYLGHLGVATAWPRSDQSGIDDAQLERGARPGAAEISIAFRDDGDQRQDRTFNAIGLDRT